MSLAENGAVLPAGRDTYVVLYQHHDPNVTGRAQRHRLEGSAWNAVGAPFGRMNAVGETSPDGRLLVELSYFYANELVAWDLSVEPPAQKWTLALGERERTDSTQRRWIAFSANQKLLGAFVPAEKGGGKPGGELLLVTQLDEKAKIATSLALPKAHRGNYRFALSPDGRYLVHNKNQDRPHEFHLEEDLSEPLPRVVQTATIRSGEGLREFSCWFAFSPGGQHLAYSFGCEVGVLEVPSFKPVWQWKTPGPVWWLDWAADGRHLVTLNGNHTVYVLRLNQLVPAAAPGAASPGG
jgi:hypothetical protein